MQAILIALRMGLSSCIMEYHHVIRLVTATVRKLYCAMKQSRSLNAPNGVARCLKCSYERSGWGYWDVKGETPSSATGVIVINETD